MAEAVTSAREGNREPADIDAEILDLMRKRAEAPLSEWGAIATGIEALTREKAAIQARNASAERALGRASRHRSKALCALIATVVFASLTGSPPTTSPAGSAEGEAVVEIRVSSRRPCGF